MLCTGPLINPSIHEVGPQSKPVKEELSSHFTNKEMGAQRSSVSCPGFCSLGVGESLPYPRSSLTSGPFSYAALLPLSDPSEGFGALRTGLGITEPLLLLYVGISSSSWGCRQAGRGRGLT